MSDLKPEYEIIKVIKQKNYAILTIIMAVFMFFFLPYVQTFGVATDLWYSTAPPLNFALFLIFIAIFGMFVSFQIYKFRGPKVCKVSGGAASGTMGTAFGFIIGVCPACAGFASLFLPLAVVTTLVILGPILMLLSIGMMLLGIKLNGGFNKN